jgi:tetratricopeptide (TPR) repeat protein
MPTEATPSTALPDAIRGYRIRSLLGAGAMGTVWRAVASTGRRGLSSGDEVALKVLDPRYAPDASIVRRFKREGGVGLGAGHPGIARVYEIGSLRVGDRRLHYIVQELLQGGSLQGRLELEGPQPEPVIREVGRQVAETLAFVHGRNIVHRDLKPANLFLDERGQVKVVDFGLARLVTEQEVLMAASAASQSAPISTGATTAGKFLGTVAYAAPEQLAGAPATPQSDLFALGLVLYEMAIGAHPFAREREEGFDAYVAAVQSRDPAPLCELRPELSWFLDRIVRLLLERDVDLRASSAAAIAEAFAAGERSRLWTELCAPSGAYVSSGRARLAVRRSTRLLGRAREVAVLADEARAAFAGRGRRVVVEGEEGAGTTRLVDALAERLERSGPRAGFFVLRASSSAAPLEPLRELLADAFDVATAADETTRRAMVGARLLELFGEHGTREDLLERFVVDGAAKTGVSSADLQDPLVAVLRAIARSAPTLLVADSAERLDAATLATLDALAVDRQPQPILLLLTRSSDVAPARASARPLAALEQGATRLSLSSLDVGAFETMARDFGLEPELVEKAGKRLHELAAGNPGSAVELAATLAGRARLDALASRKTTLPALSPALAERFSRRIAPVRGAERALLEAAAVLGAGLREPMLRDVLGLAPAEFDDLLQRLEQERRLLVRRGGELRFREPLLRRHMMAVTPKERRRAVHLLAARHYERELAQPNPPPRTALKAALHAELARERTILAATLRPAVRVLEVEGALERAWRLVTSAEEVARTPPTAEPLLASSLVLRGQLAHRLGRREDERAIWSEAARLSTHLDDPATRAQAFHGLGRLASRTGRFLAAETFLLDADRAAEKAPRGAGVDRSFILLDLAEALLWSGDEERCAKAIERAEQVIDAGASIPSIGRYFKERGNLLLELERFDEAGDSYAQGRAIVRGPALRALHRAMVLGTARLLRETADYEKSRRACELARRSAESDLDLRHLAQAWYVLGDVAARTGEPDQAFLPYVRAYRLARRIEDDYLAVSTLGALSFLYRWKRFRGHSLEKAVRCARRAIAAAKDLAVGRLEARGLAALALCYRDMKKLPWALAIARKAVREASAAGVRRRRAAEIWWVHGLILGEMGQTAAAGESLEQARALIERRLLGVASPAVRSRMMERDPLLREIEATRFGPARE